MQVYIQDDEGNLLATHANGITYTQPGVPQDILGYALFRVIMSFQAVPAMALGEDIRQPVETFTGDVEGGTP